LDHIVAAMTLDCIIATVTLDTVVAFDTITVFVIPLVTLLASAPVMWHEEHLSSLLIMTDMHSALFPVD
jgi:hypothetical protein